MTSFDSFSMDGEEPGATRSFDDGSYGGYGSYTAFSGADTPPFHGGGSGGGGGGFPGEFEAEVTVDHVSHSVDSPDPFGFGSDPDPNIAYSEPTPFGGSSVPISNGNGKAYDLADDSEGIFSSDGPILPAPNEMQEEGFALREWRRLNAIRLEEKEKREKELRNQIIEEGQDYVRAFYEKRNLNIETNKTNNREKEKVYLSGQEKFHKEADKQYWKSIAELIPNEVPNIEKRRGKKEQEKKPSIAIIQGPKPGKPTDLSRMRHILVKLKHNPPPHMIPPPPAPAKDDKAGKDAKDVKNAKAKSGKDAEAAANGSAVADAAAGPAKDTISSSYPPSSKEESASIAASEQSAATAASEQPAN